MHESIIHSRDDLNDDPYMQINIHVQSYTSDSKKIIRIKDRILVAIEHILDEERDDNSVIGSVV